MIAIVGVRLAHQIAGSATIDDQLGKGVVKLRQGLRGHDRSHISTILSAAENQDVDHLRWLTAEPTSTPNYKRNQGG